MQGDNTSKMSRMAFPQITNVHVINILICELFSRLKRDLTAEDLYNILVVESGICSYFFYVDSMNYLVSTGSLEKTVTDKDAGDSGILYKLTKRGEETSEKLNNFVSKEYIDKAVMTASKYLAVKNYKSHVKVTYEKIDGGCYVHVRYPDNENDLLDLRFKTETYEQATLIGERIRQNPNGFYKNILEVFEPGEI